jgi:immunity-related GTPase family M protein
VLLFCYERSLVIQCFFLRRVNDGDENSAEIDVVEITEPKPVSYTFRQNISIVDLPAIGTPSCPNLNIFCQKVHLETYNVFFILTATRFTEHEYELARKVKFMGKRFFLIWTKIDQDELSERRHNQDLNAMVEKIRAHLYENVKNLGIREEEIFVISNHYPDKWDFERLVQATTTLPVSQRIQLVTILSKDILAEKIKKLRGTVSALTII